jgi:hypothetical protein
VIQQYLADVPPELHSIVEPKFREMSGNFDAKFREAADFRKQWEPYAGVEGLTELDPDSLSALVSLHQIAQDDGQFSEWLKAAAGEVGWGNIIDEETWSSLGEENGWLGGDDEEGLLEKIRGLIAEEVGPVKDYVGKQQQQEGVGAAETQLREQLTAVAEDAGEAWSPEVEAEVKRLAFLHLDEDDPMAAAYEDLQRLQGGAQSDLLDEKLGQQNGTTLAGGRPDTSAPAHHLGDKSLKDSARARFAASA